MLGTVVILAGGFGTRLAEETEKIPKPLVNIGDMPILWHIMKYYFHHGFKNFVICGGYKKEQICYFFRDYKFFHGDVTFCDHEPSFDSKAEDWTVKVIDTGLNSQTAYRLKIASQHVAEDRFHFTYGDGLSNVNLSALDSFAANSNTLVTLSAVSPPARFGALSIESGVVKGFVEKSPSSEGLVNGGFGVIDKRALISVSDEMESFEETRLPSLAETGQVSALRHQGFWQPMDTLREKRLLNKLWSEGRAPWKIW